jgi:hypothetical protein
MKQPETTINNHLVQPQTLVEIMAQLLPSPGAIPHETAQSRDLLHLL